MSGAVGPSTTDPVDISSSSSDLVRCSLCTAPRFFKGNRGLNIHKSKCHAFSTPPQRNCTTQCTTDVTLSSTTFLEKLQLYKSDIPVIRRIPRGARYAVASKLKEVIKVCTETNSLNSWEKLFTFSYTVLNVDSLSKQNSCSLTSKIKKRILDYDQSQPIARQRKHISNLICCVEKKVSDGDIRGAVRLLSSEEDLATDSIETYAALKEKHPTPSRQLRIPNLPSDDHIHASVTEKAVATAIASFPNGSAGGIDGLRPQHLKDLTLSSNGIAGKELLKEITQLCNYMLSGKVISAFLPLIYGANLFALKKKCGGIRPIAVGCTFRRLVSKLASNKIYQKLGEQFRPIQLGFATKGGCEAAVHSVRTFISNKKMLML